MRIIAHVYSSFARLLSTHIGEKVKKQRKNEKCETITSINDKSIKWWGDWFDDYLFSIHKKLFDIYNVDVAVMKQRC